MAMGLLRPEICLSERAVRELSPEAQEGLLAHELGHLVRQDPLFRLVSCVIGCMFFFQPLNWLAARRLSACAELLSDDWAARRTARPLALAECLTTVARWTVSPVRGLPAAAAVTGPSDLRRRIERLVQGAGLTAGPLRPAWAGPIASFVLTALTLLAPSACGGARALERPAAAPGTASQQSECAEVPSPPDVEPDDHDAADDKDEDELSCEDAPSDEPEDAKEAQKAAKEAQKAAKEAQKAAKEAQKAAQDEKKRGKAGRAPAKSSRRARLAHPHPTPLAEAEDDTGDADDGADDADDADDSAAADNAPETEAADEESEKDAQRELERARKEMREHLARARKEIEAALGKDLEDLEQAREELRDAEEALE
jgi:hypothetical protein